MEIPVENGVYTVNLYFNEAGGPNRHFQIEIQGTIVDEDVSSLDYNPANPGTPGWVGRLPFEEILVEDGILRIGLLPCPACPGATDINPIIDGVEILPAGSAPGAPGNLVATPGNGRVDLKWDPVTPAPDGYVIYRLIDGGPLMERLNESPVTGTSYADLGLTNGVEQCYIVRAVAGGIEGANSQKACATPAAGGVFRRGDVDASAAIDLSDPITILSYLFLGQGEPACFDAADVDDSGEIDITDAIANLDFQFLGGAAPPAPGPFTCGPDANQEAPDLGCAAACQ